MNLFDLAKLEAEVERASREIEQDGFWNNLEYAQKVMREKKGMEDTLAEYHGLDKSLDDVAELIELAEMEEEAGASAEDLELMVTEQDDPLEEETATHSSILTGIVPWIEEPGRLQSMGSQRFGHD